MWTSTLRLPILRAMPVEWALLLWGVLCAACLMRSYLFPTRQSVFHDYGHAGRAWVEGTDAYRMDHDGERVIPLMSGYRYAPTVTVLLTPFAMFGDAFGGVLWRLAGILCFLGAFAWYLRDALPGRAEFSDTDRAKLWLLLVPLSLASINNAQANVLLTAFLLFAGVAVVKEHWNLAAACLAGAFLLKLYPLAVALLFMAVYPRQLVWRFLVASVLGFALPFALQSPSYVTHAYDNWLALISSDDRREFSLVEGYRDFYLLTRVIGAPLGARAYFCLQAGAGALAAGLILLGKRRGWSASELVTNILGLGCAWMVLFGPSVESCTYIQIAPALAIALGAAAASTCPRWSRYALILVFCLFVASFVSSWFRESRDWLYLAQPIAALIFFVERCVRSATQRAEPATLDAEAALAPE